MLSNAARVENFVMTKKYVDANTAKSFKQIKSISFRYFNAKAAGAKLQ